MTNSRGFEFEKETGIEPAIWESPEGPLVCCTGVETSWFILYTPEEWAACSAADLECDSGGHVLRLGRYVDYDNAAWIVPASVRKNAIG